MYLDRSIREHSLLQAIARVNRRHSQTQDDYKADAYEQ